MVGGETVAGVRSAAMAEIDKGLVWRGCSLPFEGGVRKLLEFSIEKGAFGVFHACF